MTATTMRRFAARRDGYHAATRSRPQRDGYHAATHIHAARQPPLCAALRHVVTATAQPHASTRRCSRPLLPLYCCRLIGTPRVGETIEKSFYEAHFNSVASPRAVFPALAALKGWRTVSHAQKKAVTPPRRSAANRDDGFFSLAQV